MTDHEVTAESVVLGYEGAIAISESSFTVPSGAITAIIGPNGSGKSTLLNAVARLTEPLAGTLRVATPPNRVALVLQSTAVNESLPLSARDVVAMGRYSTAGFYRRYSADDRLAIETAMDRAGVTELQHKQLHSLSGGQRQRVFVAQGLAQDHDLLLLDEPFTGIDLPTARAIDDMIHQEKSQSRTIVISTHDLTEARHADHVLLLSGRVVAQGPPSKVITPENLLSAYGASILHADKEGVFVDDPAHEPATEHKHR